MNQEQLLIQIQTDWNNHARVNNVAANVFELVSHSRVWPLKLLNATAMEYAGSYVADQILSRKSKEAPRSVGELHVWFKNYLMALMLREEEFMLVPGASALKAHRSDDMPKAAKRVLKKRIVPVSDLCADMSQPDADLLDTIDLSNKSLYAEPLLDVQTHDCGLTDSKLETECRAFLDSLSSGKKTLLKNALSDEPKSLEELVAAGAISSSTSGERWKQQLGISQRRATSNAPRTDFDRLFARLDVTREDKGAAAVVLDHLGAAL